MIKRRFWRPVLVYWVCEDVLVSRVGNFVLSGVLARHGLVPGLLSHWDTGSKSNCDSFNQVELALLHEA